LRGSVSPLKRDSTSRHLLFKKHRRHTGLAKSLSEQVLPGYASATQAIHAASFATPPDLYPAAPLGERSQTLVASVREKSITVDHLNVSIRLGVFSRNVSTTDEPALAFPTAQSLPGAIEALERRMIEDCGFAVRRDRRTLSGAVRFTYKSCWSRYLRCIECGREPACTCHPATARFRE
jgi:hypothetical protein